MSNELEKSFEDAQRTVAQMRERTRMLELMGKAAAGRPLTPEESKELAELRARHAADKKGDA